MNYLSDLHAGRAGEFLVAADLLRYGLDCSFAGQGMPYDLVADHCGRLIKVQVKTTRRPERLTGRDVERFAYRFWVSRCGKGGKARYESEQVDLFALVALDTGEIGYLHSSEMVRTLFIRPSRLRGTYCDEIKSARNAEILSLITSGASIEEICDSHEITRGYASKIKHGRARHVVQGYYMDEYRLDDALEKISS